MSTLNARDKKTGRYSAGLDRLCECGHRLGDHTAGGIRECLIVTYHEFHHVACPCDGFVKAKHRPTAKKPA